jgi:hypothetical protein
LIKEEKKEVRWKVDLDIRVVMSGVKEDSGVGGMENGV